jgi:hypothetical protein
VNDEPGGGQRVTTVNLYSDDLAWLKQYQLQVSGRAKKWLPMPDIIRELVQAADLGQQPGIAMVPMITDPETFAQRTAEMRAQGLTTEADARDRFMLSSEHKGGHARQGKQG